MINVVSNKMVGKYHLYIVNQVNRHSSVSGVSVYENGVKLHISENMPDSKTIETYRNLRTVKQVESYLVSQLTKKKR